MQMQPGERQGQGKGSFIEKTKQAPERKSAFLGISMAPRPQSIPTSLVPWQLIRW